MKKLLNPILIILFAITLRLLPHPANMAPIAAMALFGGVYLNKKYALIVPLVAMVISDIFLGFSGATPMVYVSFFITGLIGLWLKKRTSIKNIIFSSIFSSCIFFLLTNCNYWFTSSLYPKTFIGLLQSYTMALPFFRNTLIGDLLYVGLFFGGYALIRHCERSVAIFSLVRLLRRPSSQ